MSYQSEATRRSGDPGVSYLGQGLDDLLAKITACCGGGGIAPALEKLVSDLVNAELARRDQTAQAAKPTLTPDVEKLVSDLVNAELARRDQAAQAATTAAKPSLTPDGPATTSASSGVPQGGSESVPAAAPANKGRGGRGRRATEP